MSTLSHPRMSVKELGLQVLFVHGMGRSPLSGGLLLWLLKRAGLKLRVFGYSVSFDDFAGIRARLVERILQLAVQGDYVLVGHSLGGVLLRAALNDLPPDTRRASHLFLLGSPVRAARLAQRLRNNPVYKIVTRDCGRLLGSAERMAEIGSVAVPTTVVVGVRGLPWPKDPFDGEPNDGVVARSEVCADWAGEEVHVPVGHTFLPASRRVAQLILQRIGGRLM